MRSKPPAKTASSRPVRQPRTASRTERRRALAVAADDRRPGASPSPTHAHAAALVAAAAVGRLEHVEPGLRPQRPQRGEARDRRAPAEAAPGRCSVRPPGASRARAPRPGTWRRCAAPNSGSPSTRSSASAGSPASSASSAASSSSSRWAARRTSAAGGRRALRIRFSSERGAAQPGLHAVAQLDPARAPRRGPRPPRSPARPSAPAARPLASSPSASTRARPPRTPPRAPSSRPPPPARASAASTAAERRRHGGRRVRVHERDLQAVTAGPHEQELVPSRHVVAGDRQRERRQEVPLDRALQRPRAEVGREALGEQELERGIVELDRPLAPAQAAPREHRLQLGGQDLAHHRARQRPEDDRAVDPVEELGPERARHRLLDAARREPAAAGREPDPGPGGSARRGSRS